MVASFRTREGGFRYRISLPYRKSLFFTPNASENASRTPGSLFEHRMRIPYRRRPSPVPNATKPERGKSLLTPNSSNCQKRRDQCKKRSPGCRREQENHSLRPQNTNALHNLPVTTATHPTTSIHSHLPQAVRKVRFSKCNRPSGPFWQG